MMKRTILLALISLIVMPFTAKSQTTYDTKGCKFKISINSKQIFFKDIKDFSPPNPSQKSSNAVATTFTLLNGIFNNVAKNNTWLNPRNQAVDLFLIDDKGKEIHFWRIGEFKVVSVNCPELSAAVPKINSLVINGYISYQDKPNVFK